MLQSRIGPLDRHASHRSCGFGRPPGGLLLVPASAPRQRPAAHPAPRRPATPASRIEWEVKNRFRLFRREADFQRHVVANRAGSQLAAEHQLERDTGGRGWAQNQVDHLCVNAAGALLETCERDGERENYLAPKNHLVVARLDRRGAAGRDLQLELRRRHHPAQAGQRALRRSRCSSASPTASRPSPRSASRGPTTASTASRPKSRCAIS